MKTRLFMFAVLILILTTVAMAADPFVGTWKFNMAKSNAGGFPAPKSWTLKVKAIGNDINVTGDIVLPDGKTLQMAWTGKYDGKDYPTTGDPATDTSSFRKIDTNTLEKVDKKAGKEVVRWQITFPSDGKTFAGTTKVKDPQGQDLSIVLVFDKQ